VATLQGRLLRETCGGACGWSANRQGSSIGRPMRRAGPLHRVTLRFSTKWIVSVCCSDISLPQCYGSTTTRQSQKRGQLSFGGSSRQRAAGTSSASRLEVRAFTRSPPGLRKDVPMLRYEGLVFGAARVTYGSSCRLRIQSAWSWCLSRRTTLPTPIFSMMQWAML